MTDTQGLLKRIAGLRQRLEQRPTLASPDEGAPAEVDPLIALARKVEAGHQHDHLLDGSVRRLTEEAGAAGPFPTLPRHLTARARRLLLQGQQLLARLRSLADEALLAPETDDPLAVRYRRTLAMADTALRLVQAYPESPGMQLKLCEGLEATLDTIDERLNALTAAVGQRRRAWDLVHGFAGLLNDLAAGRPVELAAFVRVAERIVTAAQDAEPVRFFQADDTPASHVACHGLVTAQVVARVTRQDPELRSQVLELTLAALIHDAGMLCIEPEAWLHSRPLTDPERRRVEAHTRAGADLASRLLPGGGWLMEACAGHHERLDGTGYPEGLRDLQITPLVRLLAVCDTYAALCQPRQHRAAREPRTALTDTLLMAEKGQLDRQMAERLLQLSFYPVGSVVELADGALARVVAHHQTRHDVTTAGRPVLAVLTDSQGQPLPWPRHVDLAQAEGWIIVRAVPPGECQHLLGSHYVDAA